MTRDERAFARLAKRRRNVAGRLIPVRRFLLQQFVHHGGERWTDAERGIDGRHRMSDVLERDRDGRLPFVRQLPDQHLVEHDPDAVEIRGVVQIVPLRLLG